MSTVSRKYLMAFTGLFICVFLVVHLAGNLQLLLPAESAQEQFNNYATFLSSLLIIKIISWGLYASIILHAVYALIITLANRKAAGNGKYSDDNRSRASSWASRNMGILGSILLVFLVVHMTDFWYVYKFGSLPLDAAGNKDLYTIVINSFQDLWYVVLYVVAFIALGYHLWHGFFSAFRTLGIFPAGLATLFHYAGMIYTIVITAGFIIIPVYLYLNQVTS